MAVTVQAAKLLPQLFKQAIKHEWMMFIQQYVTQSITDTGWSRINQLHRRGE